MLSLSVQLLSSVQIFATPCTPWTARLPNPSPGACSNSCPLSWWCHPTISFSVIPFSSCLQSFPAPGSFPMNQLFASGGQSIGTSASASVLPMNMQDQFPLGLTGLISLLCTHSVQKLKSLPDELHYLSLLVDLPCFCTNISQLL